MQRREFIMLFGGTAATWPLAARAQQPTGRVYQVGYLSIGSSYAIKAWSPGSYAIKAFEEGLRRLGYRVGENVAIEYRFADKYGYRLFTFLDYDHVPWHNNDAEQAIKAFVKGAHQ